MTAFAGSEHWSGLDPALRRRSPLQKVHAALDHAVPLRGEQIGIAVEQEIEVR